MRQNRNRDDALDEIDMSNDRLTGQYVTSRDEGFLYDLETVARKMMCSREHVLALIDDGELEYINLARPGSKHREIRITCQQILLYASRRTCRKAAPPVPASIRTTRGLSTTEAPSNASFASRYRAAQRNGGVK